MSIIDLGIIVIYLGGLLYMGVRLGRGNETQEDYFVAGRSMGWMPVALSIAATTISGNGLIGGPGWSYQSGMKAFMLNASIPLVLAIVCCWFLPFLYHIRVTSCYEYLQKRFGEKSRILGAAGFLVTALIQVSSMVYIPSLIISQLTGWDIRFILVLIVIISTGYTLLGGIKAVIWTDAIQMAVVWGGLFAIVFLALQNLDIGFWDTIQVAREAGKLTALDFSLSLEAENGFFVTLLGGGILWMQYYMADQSQVQRMFAAKSVKVVKRSLLTSGILMNTMYFLFMIIGFIMFSVYNGQVFKNTNQVMIQFIADQVPVGVMGCIIAGIFAAAMSSVDSLLNSMATVFIKDIYEKRVLKGKREASLKVSRYFTLTMAVIIVIFASFAYMDTTASILATVGSYISYLCGAILGMFLLGMLTEKANDFGVSIGFFAGVAGTVILARLFPVNYLWYNVTGLALTMGIGYLASILHKRQPDQTADTYTLKGCRLEIRLQMKENPEMVGDLPGCMDKYAWGLALFFIIQYLVLFVMQ
ncbi:MAG: sodium/solute symporter [Muricomes sp.]|uniref:sodium:solute symporter family transporter n=1 Tax=Faecalicatena contorta TaxID=39482 RepID=UPI002EB0D3DA|nr:sodium/solute symporter [Muricomes sp.]